MDGPSSAASGRLVGAGLTALALALFALVDLLGLTGTARALAFLGLAGLLSVGAMVALVAWLIRRQSRPLTDRPEQWEIEAQWDSEE